MSVREFYNSNFKQFITIVIVLVAYHILITVVFGAPTKISMILLVPTLLLSISAMVARYKVIMKVLKISPNISKETLYKKPWSPKSARKSNMKSILGKMVRNIFIIWIFSGILFLGEYFYIQSYLSRSVVFFLEFVFISVLVVILILRDRRKSQQQEVNFGTYFISTSKKLFKGFAKHILVIIIVMSAALGVHFLYEVRIVLGIFLLLIGFLTSIPLSNSVLNDSMKIRESELANTSSDQ